ncbi:MAG: hypothetical protein OEY85_01895 [Rhodospirillales bacterium]|nr:hypothetical protein [Rhodospirillales bacterium]
MRKLILIVSAGLLAVSFAATASAECLGHKDRTAGTSTETGSSVAESSKATTKPKS